MIKIGIPMYQWLINFQVRKFNRLYEEDIEYYISWDNGIMVRVNDINHGHNYSSDWIWQNNWRRLGSFLRFMDMRLEDLTAMKKLTLYFGTVMADSDSMDKIAEEMKESGFTIRTEILE